MTVNAETQNEFRSDYSSEMTDLVTGYRKAKKRNPRVQVDITSDEQTVVSRKYGSKFKDTSTRFTNKSSSTQGRNQIGRDSPKKVDTIRRMRFGDKE